MMLASRVAGSRGRYTRARVPCHQTGRYECQLRHTKVPLGSAIGFIEDLMLHEHLQSLAGEEGFAIDVEPAFTIPSTCAKCLQPSKEGQGGARTSHGEVASGSVMAGTGAGSVPFVRSAT